MPPETAPVVVGVDESGVSPGHELEQLRRERALLCELLAAQPESLSAFMALAVRRARRVRHTLHRRARQAEEFQDKLAMLDRQVRRLAAQSRSAALPTLAADFQHASELLRATARSSAPSGDELLPALAAIEAGLLSLALISARTGLSAEPASSRPEPGRRPRVRAPKAAHGSGSGSGLGAAAAGNRSNTEVPPLVQALTQLATRLAAEQGKQVELVISGFEQAPAELYGALYDVLAQLLRNAIEHGIESPARRLEADKNAAGTVRAAFSRRAEQAELVFEDDGQGLQADLILQAGMDRGLINRDVPPAQSPQLASSLIFHADVSTAVQPAGRGQGMGIVRDHVKRMGGRIQVASKRERFTRIRIRLPLAAAGAGAQPGTSLRA